MFNEVSIKINLQNPQNLEKKFANQMKKLLHVGTFSWMCIKRRLKQRLVKEEENFQILTVIMNSRKAT